MQKQFMKKLLNVPCYEHVEDHSSPARSNGKNMRAQDTYLIDRGVEHALLDVDDQMRITMREVAQRSQSLAWTTATL